MTDDLRLGIKALCDYFVAGQKTCGKWSMGFELEQIIVDADNYTVPYAGPGGINEILARLSPKYDREIRTDTSNPNSPLIGLMRDSAAVSLEPGAQFEFSSPPYWDLRDLTEGFEVFQSELFAVCDEYGYAPITIGYQPRTKVDDITLLPKERYAMMNHHFAGQGTHGKNMMRGTASTQVTIDYYSEDDAVAKMRIAAALTPLLSLLTDNTPIFEDAPVKGYLQRTAIWNDVDPDRSMIPPGLFSDGYGFADYAKTVLTAPVVLFDHAGTTKYGGQTGAAELYNTAALTKGDIEHILSMFFFDVRLRNYVEMRSADSMPFPYGRAFVALVKGLFYDDQNLHELGERFANFTDDCVPAIKRELMAQGYDADLQSYYGTDAQGMLQELLDRARQGLARMTRDFPDASPTAASEAAHLELFDALVARKNTLAGLLSSTSAATDS